MNERQKGRGKFVVLRGDASELLDAVEETLDQVAILVEVPIELARVEAIGARRDDRLAALGHDQGGEGIRIVGLVGGDVGGRLILDQGCRLLDVGPLSGRENDAQRVAQGIDRDMQAWSSVRRASGRCAGCQPFLGAGRMLMGAHNGGIEKQLLQVGVAAQALGHALPDTVLTPAGEAHIRPVPMPEFLGQVAPWAAGTHDPQDGLDEAPIVPCSAARIAHLARQQLFNPLPLVIT